LVDFKNIIKTTKDIAAVFNGGTVKGVIDDDVELLEIEPLHTSINGSNIVVLIEPVDLSIDNNVNVGMSVGGEFYGRVDGIATYKHTRRTLRVGFKMVKSYILNGAEAVSSNAMTANMLQQLVYPAYTATAKQNTSVLKTPPFFRILYGDLIGDFKGGQRKGLPGFISGLSVSLGRGNVGENLNYGVNETVLPVEYTVSIDFQVLHDHPVGWYDGKFAGDGRTNFPFNTGVVINQTADGPGMAGGNPGAGEKTAVPESPSAVVAQANESGNSSMVLNTQNNPNPVKGIK